MTQTSLPVYRDRFVFAVAFVEDIPSAKNCSVDCLKKKKDFILTEFHSEFRDKTIGKIGKAKEILTK